VKQVMSGQPIFEESRWMEDQRVFIQCSKKTVGFSLIGPHIASTENDAKHRCMEAVD
jgi:hypothetical protein